MEKDESSASNRALLIAFSAAIGILACNHVFEYLTQPRQQEILPETVETYVLQDQKYIPTPTPIQQDSFIDYH